MKYMIMRKKILGVLMVLIMFCACVPQTPKTETVTVEELKVLAWNIWHGGHSKAYPGKSCEGTMGILKKSGADVILMIETYGCSDLVADHLGYYHRLLSDNLSVYSRYPIMKTYTFPDSITTSNFGGVELDVNGKRVRVFDTWLHYLPDMRLVPTEKTEAEILAWDDEGTRDEEIKRILSVLQPILAEVDSIPVIIGGDFNDHSHLDWTESTKNMYNHGGAVVNWTVSKIMEEAGFKDSFRELHPDPAEELGPTWYWTGGKKNRLDRIDFIYYKGNKLKAVESESYNADLPGYLDFYGEKFFYASDHGFVITTFSLNQNILQ